MINKPDKPGQWSHRESDWDQQPPADMWRKIESKLDTSNQEHRGVFSLGITRIAASVVVLVACVGLISYWLGYRQGGEDMVMERIISLEEVAVSDKVGFYEKVEQGSQELYEQYRQRKSYASTTSRNTLIIRDISTEPDLDGSIAMESAVSRKSQQQSSREPQESALARTSPQDMTDENLIREEEAVSRKSESREFSTIRPQAASAPAPQDNADDALTNKANYSKAAEEDQVMVTADLDQADGETLSDQAIDTMPEQDVRRYAEKQRLDKSTLSKHTHSHGDPIPVTSIYGTWKEVNAKSEEKIMVNDRNADELWLIQSDKAQVRLIHGNYTELFTIKALEGSRTVLGSPLDPSKEIELIQSDRHMEMKWYYDGELTQERELRWQSN